MSSPTTRSKLTAVLCLPGQDAQVVELSDDVAALQKAVGGYVAEVKFSGGSAGGIMAYVHDEGVLIGLPWNRQVGPRTYLAGPIVVTGYDAAGETRSLGPAEVLDVLHLLNDVALRLEAKPSSMDELETWLGEKAVRHYSGDFGSMVETCTSCGRKLEPESRGFCPTCHPEKRP